MAETIEIRTGDKRKTNIALTRDGLFIQASFIDDLEAPGPTEIWCGEFAAPDARALAAALTQMADRIEGKEQPAGSWDASTTTASRETLHIAPTGQHHD